jgi:Rieske 2Fe-2S family protein
MTGFSRVARLLRERRPGHSLPQGLYLDPEVFAFDQAEIIRESWVILGLECEFTAPGAALATMVGGSPVVVVRDQGGELRGYHNSCRHRGAMVCPPGRSQRPVLVCPYHQWTYTLQGKLVGARRMQAEFDSAEHGLKPIHVRTAAGCVYVCLSNNPPEFDAFREGLEPLLGVHDLKNTKLVHEQTFLEKANWKLVMENARECYHCAVRHPHLAKTFPTEVRAHFEPDEDGRTERFHARMAACGLSTEQTVGDWWQGARFGLNDGVVSLTMDGKHACRKLLVDKAGGDIGSFRWATDPSSFAHALADHVFVFMAEPSTPGETLVTAKWYVHKDAVEGEDYTIGDLTSLWLVTNQQDIELVENNQLGVNSAGYIPGPYSHEAESLVMRFTDWYCRAATRALNRMG